MKQIFSMKNMEVLTSKSKRIEKERYHNEIIVIDTDTNTKYKVEFYTRDCGGFEIIKTRDMDDTILPYEGFDFFDKETILKINQERQIIQNGNWLIRITQYQ